MSNDYLTTLRYTQRLAQLKRERPAAVMRRLTHCVRCGVCCWHSPAQLSPSDLTRLATHEQLTPNEYFIRNCALSLINEQLSVVLLRSGQTTFGGEMLPPEQRLNLDTPCHYLDKSGCRIHDYKPQQCVRAKCWLPQTMSDMSWSAAELAKIGVVAHELNFGV